MVAAKETRSLIKRFFFQGSPPNHALKKLGNVGCAAGYAGHKAGHECRQMRTRGPQKKGRAACDDDAVLVACARGNHEAAVSDHRAGTSHDSAQRQKNTRSCLRHTATEKHARIHQRTHKNKHVRAHTHTHTQKRTHAHTHAHAHAHTHTHTHTRTP